MLSLTRIRRTITGVAKSGDLKRAHLTTNTSLIRAKTDVHPVEVSAHREQFFDSSSGCPQKASHRQADEQPGSLEETQELLQLNLADPATVSAELM